MRALLLLPILAGFVSIINYSCSQGVDPSKHCAVIPGFNTALFRLGKTRFYIIQDKKGEHYTNWTGAIEKCFLKHYRLGVINHMTTMAVVSRRLEQVVTKHGFGDNWYWIYGKYDRTPNEYRWKYGENKPLLYNNFFYRPNRPIGVGGYYTWYNTYDKYNDKIEQCLALSLPYPKAAKAEPNDVVYGFSAAIEERPCIGSRHRFSLCESTLPQCAKSTDDPYMLSDDSRAKKNYFDEGNWIIGTRKYILHWGHMSHKDAVAYCDQWGLVLYQPSDHDDCLIPYIKMWSRNVTVSQYWTNWTYNEDKHHFLNPKGEEISLNGKPWTEDKPISGRSDKLDSTMCVAMHHAYELSSQMACTPSQIRAGTCHWNFINYMPANCNNRHAVICQHKDHAKRGCEWKPDYVRNISVALEDTATTRHFGWQGNNLYVRSKYKQTFGSFLCPKHYKMVRATDEYWYKNRKQSIEWRKQEYFYDYIETYWVVDSNGFNKTMKSNCTVSSPSSKGNLHSLSRNLLETPCAEWHFYLCKLIHRGIRKHKMTSEQTNWEWGNKPTHRQYPATRGFNRTRALLIWLNTTDF